MVIKLDRAFRCQGSTIGIILYYSISITTLPNFALTGILKSKVEYVLAGKVAMAFVAFHASGATAVNGHSH